MVSAGQYNSPLSSTLATIRGASMRQLIQYSKYIQYSKSIQISSPLLSGISTLEAAAATLTGKDNKKERAAKGKEVAELKAEQYHGCSKSTQKLHKVCLC